MHWKNSIAFRVGIAWSVLLLPATCRGDVFVEHVSPAAIERGKTTRVTFSGRELANAMDVWHSLPAGTLKAKKIASGADQAVFEIEAAASAPVGLCGLRLASRDGLGNAFLFLIDDLPMRASAKSDVPMKVALPASITGTFRESGVDRFAIEVKAGQKVSFETVGSRFGKDSDPLLTIRDDKGKWIAEHDNDQGLYYDCRFEYHFAKAGTYTLELRDARFRGVGHPYVLRMGKFPAARVALPSAVRGDSQPLHLPEIGTTATFHGEPTKPLGLFSGMLKRPDDEGSTWLPLNPEESHVTVAMEPDPSRGKGHTSATSLPATLGFNWSPLRANPFLPLDVLLIQGKAQATPSQVPGALCGVLRSPGERQTFAFDLAKGQRIFVRGEAKSLNSPADLEIALVDRHGRELRRGNDDRDEITLDFTANTAGTYGLSVRDRLHDGGSAFTYQLTVRETPFPPRFTAEVEGLTIPQGDFQPVPITVTRNGNAGPIKLKLLGEPSGRLRITPDEIGEKESAVVCKLHADAGLPCGLYSIQLVAESADGKSLVRTTPLIDRQIINVDLIPLALREDQKRLPPSLHDRLAVFVTEPAPFTFEIPAASIILPRYQQAAIPIKTTRQSGFKEPIAFTAKGGQIADKNEGRTRVYAEFPKATAEQLEINGSVHSKILSNIGKTRIEVTGTALHNGRRIQLTRTFELDLKPAFEIAAVPANVSLLPGEAVKVRLLALRVKSFSGDVVLRISPIPGIEMPETVTIPQGKPGVEMEMRAAADAMPRKQNLQLNATGTVNGFEEEQRAGPVEIEIKKVEPPKKK